MEIRILSRRGMSIRAIARELWISKNTVCRYLCGEAGKTPDRCGSGRPRKLAPYEYWNSRGVEDAFPIRLRATVLCLEVTAMGFDGTVRRFVTCLYPPPEPVPIMRFETAPGHQAQIY